MQKRKLGNSNIDVSVVGLGCNNFGGRIDLAGTRAVVHRALDLGVTLFDTADVYGNRGKLGGVPRRDPRRAAQGRRARHQVRHADGQSRGSRGASRALHHARGRSEPQAAAHRLDRPLPAAPARSRDADRGDVARARRSGAAGQGARTSAARIFRRRELDAAQRRASTRHGLPPSSPARTNTACSRAASRSDAGARRCERHGLGLLPYFPLASGLLTGKYRRNAPLPDGRAARLEPRSRGRFHQRAQLDPDREARRSSPTRRGHTLLELAFGWLLAKPVVQA